MRGGILIVGLFLVSLLVLTGCTLEVKTGEGDTYQVNVEKKQTDNKGKTTDITKSSEVSIKRCNEVCFEVVGDIPVKKDACRNTCENVYYYGGNKALEKTIQTYEFSIQFEKDLESGVYNLDIEQCGEWKIESIEAENSEYTFFGNFDDSHQRELTTHGCGTTSTLKSWVEDGKEQPFGIEWKEQADKINNWHNKIMEECYPILFEYKTLVYTSRGELDEHNLEIESRHDCRSRARGNYSIDFSENLAVIIEDMPNWK